LGLFLNELGDVISDAALYLPFALRPGFDAALIVGIVILAITSEMAGVLGTHVGSTRRSDGPFGKSDRALAFGILALVLSLGVQPGAWTVALLWMLLFLQAWTNVNRVQHALMQGA
jgi:CDP-diacylglycerol--glycerol-3-phosphate 3-phosphatidyltransferase